MFKLHMVELAPLSWLFDFGGSDEIPVVVMNRGVSRWADSVLISLLGGFGASECKFAPFEQGSEHVIKWI